MFSGGNAPIDRNQRAIYLVTTWAANCRRTTYSHASKYITIVDGKTKLQSTSNLTTAAIEKRTKTGKRVQSCFQHPVPCRQVVNIGRILLKECCQWSFLLLQTIKGCCTVTFRRSISFCLRHFTGSLVGKNRRRKYIFSNHSCQRVFPSCHTAGVVKLVSATLSVVQKKM